jgi:spermidine synthase
MSASAPAPALVGREGWRHTDRVIVAAFVASGAAGLMYQVVWSQQLVLVFGNTSEAIGTIVTAFMAGLGLGGLVGGLLGPRLRRPLLAYGVVEVAVGAAALLVPRGLELIAGAYATTYDTTGSGQLTLVRLLLTMAALTPVTFLMGLTLPLLTRHLVDSMRVAGARMGQLYGANTLGAMAGTLCSGLVLIELLGFSGTAYVAVALNVLAGCIALFLARTGVTERTERLELEQPASQEHVDDPGRDAPGLRGLRAILLVATFVSGFVALALEVLWTRLLAEGSGSLGYHFVVILAIYLLGIAVGGGLYRTRSSPERDTPRTLALAFVGVAASTLLTVTLGRSLGSDYMARALILLPGTICMGYAFPLSARLLTRDAAHGARSIGVLYACNTAGSILGSLGATFVLATTLGTNRSILVLGAADAAVAVALLAMAARVGPRSLGPRSLGRSPRLTPLAAASVALVLLPPLLAGTPLSRTSTEQWLTKDQRPYQHLEDRLSTVDSEGGAPADRRIYVSGTAMTALSVDTKLMAYIPKAIHPDATRFLNIAFGMGTTYRSAINLGLRTDAVDLSPSVPKQMPTFYPDAERYLHSPLGRIITADGHNYVRLSSSTYDIISVDPPPPIESAGTGVLYSQEFYADAHRRLNHGGLMLQWLYLGVTMNELKQHLHTFRSVFPHIQVLISPMQGGIYLLGSDSPISWDAGTVERVLGSPGAARDIGDAPDYWRLGGRPWPSVLNGMRWMDGRDVDRFAGSAPVIRDDRPLTQYFMLRRTFIDRDDHVSAGRLRASWP